MQKQVTSAKASFLKQRDITVYRPDYWNVLKLKTLASVAVQR